MTRPSSALPLRRAARFAAALSLALGFALTFGVPAHRAAAQDTPIIPGDVYTVQPGDTLYRIAVTHGTDVTTLASLNALANTWRIYAGQQIVLPAATPADPAIAPPVESALAAPAAAPAVGETPMYHTVGYGEHLGVIARRYGLTTNELVAINSIVNPNIVYVGQRLVVGYEAAPAEAAPAAPALADAAPAEPMLLAAPALEQMAAPAAAVSHTVQAGELLSNIAQQYGVPWTAIAQANGLSNANIIYAGQQLVIPGASVNESLPTVIDYSLVALDAAPPAPRGVGREVLVDLSDSRVYAYENGALVRSVLISAGKPSTPTVIGDFTVQRKYSVGLMAGYDYYTPDVPWIMYFYSGYALHGAYWHNNWGTAVSHGCVNLPVAEAEWFFYFTDIGTPVRVQA